MSGILDVIPKNMDKRKIFSVEKRIKALIFDLDGVITQTRDTHKAAWKDLFDQYFQSINNGTNNLTAMTDDDYKTYIDGKPRYEGIKSFLESKDIVLPFGEVNDSPDVNTICGLGNRKNIIFNDYIDKGGIEIYEEAIKSLKHWRKMGMKTAIVSSSKNTKKIIEKAGIAELFDARVDGVVSEERNLRGKPDPDIFLEAASDINVSPQDCVVFEDAISGVQAGQKGKFGLVVGVSRFNNRAALLENGADIAIDDFAGFDLFNDSEVEEILNPPKPQLFSEESKIFEIIADKKPVFFLDYDGTLTPIVSRPEDAVISDEMKQILSNLAASFTVAIITGRDTKDVQNLVRLDKLIYAGSHGYSISGPDNLHKEHEKAEEIVSALDEIEEKLIHEFTGKREGVQIERKRYAIAIHYRNAQESDIPHVYDYVHKILAKYESFKKGEGKKIVEIKPNLNWHKGKSVLWILDALDLADREKYLPIYIGDDITDEDAFRTLKGNGIGILVGSHGKDTEADYTLKNIYQVKEFFSIVLRNAGRKKTNRDSA